MSFLKKENKKIIMQLVNIMKYIELKNILVRLRSFLLLQFFNHST